MRPRLCNSSRSRRIVISELVYFLASSRTRARPFWFTKSTIARRRSSFITEVRLTGIARLIAYDHIRAGTKTKEENGGCPAKNKSKPWTYADRTDRNEAENQTQRRIMRRARRN